MLISTCSLDLFKAGASAPAVPSTSASSLHEVDKYLAMGVVSVVDKKDPLHPKTPTLLEFWSQQEELQVMQLLGRDALPSQGTSCSSERVASACKSLLQERGSLDEISFRYEMLMREWKRTGIKLAGFPPTFNPDVITVEEDASSESDDDPEVKKRRIEV